MYNPLPEFTPEAIGEVTLFTSLNSDLGSGLPLVSCFGNRLCILNFTLTFCICIEVIVMN